MEDFQQSVEQLEKEWIRNRRAGFESQSTRSFWKCNGFERICCKASAHFSALQRIIM